MPRLPAALLLLTFTACASVPTDRSVDPTDQRYKRGSVLHGYGTTLVVMGVSAMLGGVSQIAIGEAYKEQGGKNRLIVPGLVSLGAGALFTIIGERLVASGNDEFTPPLPSVDEHRGSAFGGWVPSRGYTGPSVDLEATETGTITHVPKRRRTYSPNGKRE